VEIIREQSLIAVARSLAGCTLTLTNDSGLLHLSEAVGTPVVALFGPTVRAFGYQPTLPQSRLLEVDLDCRPCSRNGKRPCWRGDHACLASLAPEQVLDAVLKAGGWPPTSANPGEALR
jgi:heptosyltransferase-2